MIIARQYSFLALASGAVFLGFWGWGTIDIRPTERWGIRCDLQPDISLENEIAQCEEILAEQVYEGEALGEVYFRLGYFHDRLGEWQKAYEYYQTARRMRPARVSAHYNSARILGRKMQDWEGVVEATTDVINLVPAVKNDHSGAWEMRASALYKLGRTDEALADIAVALSIDPGRSSMVRLRAKIDQIQNRE